MESKGNTVSEQNRIPIYSSEELEDLPKIDIDGAIQITEKDIYLQ